MSPTIIRTDALSLYDGTVEMDGLTVDASGEVQLPSGSVLVVVREADLSVVEEALRNEPE